MEENKSLIKKKQKKDRFFNKKMFISGGVTFLTIILIIALYIGINILLEKVTLPEIDLTKDKLYSISTQTKDKLEKLDKEVEITLINYKEGAISDLVEKYKALNNNIKIEKIEDLTKRSDIAQKYSLESTDSLIIVKSGDIEKLIGSSDLYTYDYNTGDYKDLTEEAITNAIVNVTASKKPKIYFMNNNILYNSSYFSAILSLIENEANEVKSLDILSNGEVPADCDTLIITTLKQDITEKERDEILKYIKKGGNLLIMAGPNYDDLDLKNFQKVLDEYGVSISNGVIFEGETSSMIRGYPNIILEQVQDNPITSRIKDTLYLCLINSGKLTFNENKLEELGVTYEKIVTTSEKAYERTDFDITSGSKTEKDKDASEALLAALVTKSYKKENEDEIKSELVIFANEMFATNTPMQTMGYPYALYNNKDMVLNSIAYLNKQENTITIRKDSNNVTTYTLTKSQYNTIMTIIFSVPVLIMLTGIIIWITRRRKK